MQLEDWLDDLCVRFIINLPENDLSSVERICFAVEEAQWYYEDFIRPLDPNLPSLNLRNFSLRIFAHCPLLAPFSQGEHMAAFDEFLRYKTRIPVRGAILMNHEMDAAVLVKGWKKGANWSFPRGKINYSEDDLTCAAREVYEETGFDVEAAGLIPEDRQVKHIEISMHDQQMTLYVFRDVPMNTHFEPRTRKEISKIQWWRLSDLPAYRKGKHAQQQQNGPAISPNKFYMVAPFLPHLRRWVIEQKKQDAKQSMSNQYLSAGFSHDDVLTEEDQGTESNTQGPSYPTHARQHIDTLEGTNEALRALLKIQPPANGLQSGAATVVQSPVVENKGNALLALLQGRPAQPSQEAPTNAVPHNPLDHTITQAPQPGASLHQQLLPPHISTLPRPPTFPLQQLPPNSFSYVKSIQHDIHHTSTIPGFPQSHHQAPTPNGNQHSYQSPHLVHPQPLPPHVQRAVFTGGPAHSPVVPQQLYQSQPNPATISGPSNPQFQGAHAPMVAPVQAQPPAKLTSHHLTLLNAFKNHDEANGASLNNDGPQRRFTEAPAQPQPLRPQELPAEVARPPAADPSSQLGGNQAVLPTQNPNLLAPKPISEEQRSTLLGLFKNPTSQAVVPVRANAALVLPMSSTPSAVELSAVDTLSVNAAQASPAASHRKTAKMHVQNATALEMNPETNLPFRAMKILARPTQESDSEGPRGNGSAPKARSNEKRPASKSKPQQVGSSEKPFQPQILKRSQSTTPKTVQSSATPSPSALPIIPTLPVKVQSQTQPTDNHKQNLLSLLGKSPLSAGSSLPRLDRRTTQPTNHKEKLLSLFEAPSPVQAVKGTATEDVLSPLFSIDPTLNTAARSRMGSLASGEASRRSSQTQMSPADKGFLLSYLDSVTKGVQR